MGWFLVNRQSVLLVIVFGLAASLLRYFALAQTPYANGWDGYYYVMQAHSWITYGHLQSQDFSLIYPYFTLLSFLTGDFVQAYKIGSAMIGGAIVGVSCLVALRFSIESKLAWLCGSVLLFSPTLVYFTSQFPKNGLGLIFFLMFLKAFHNNRWPFWVAFALLSLLTHRMMGGLCILILIFRWLHFRHWKWLLGGGILSVLLSLLPGILHISDLSRFEEQFVWVPEVPFWSFYSLFEDSMNMYWVFELISMALLLLGSIYTYIRQKAYESENPMIRWVFPMLIFVCVFPFLLMDSGTMGYRFFLIVPVFLILMGTMQIRKINKIVHVLPVIFMFFSFFSYKAYNPQKHDPPNEIYEIIVSRLQEAYSNDHYQLVIAHKSLAEMIIYETEFDALNWSIESNGKDDRVLRIVHNLDKYHFAKYLAREDLKKVRKLTLKYYSLPNQLWRKYLSQVRAMEDEDLLDRIAHGANPLKERPNYLRKGKN